jgi:hypothetical protein
MDVLGIAGFAVGLIGTAISVAVVLRARQLSRPLLRLTIGHPSIDEELPGTARRTQTTTLIAGAPERILPHIIAVPFFIQNRSRIAITDLSLRIEYSSEHLLTDGTPISDPTQQPLVTLQMNAAAKREAMTVLDRAYISFDVGLVRPDDTVVLWEFLSVGSPVQRETSGSEPSDTRIVRALTRFQHVQGFRDFVILDVVARSSNCAALATSVNIIWSAVESPEALDRVGEECVANAWDGAKPPPGLYFDPLRIFRPRHLRRIVHEERLLLLFLGTAIGRYASSPKEIADRTLAAHFTTGVLYAPPWGLTGKAIDLAPILGVPVVPARQAQSDGSKPVS